ncbi:MAG: DNA-directed RNA polymerase subunit F [Thermoprotei archaeon]|nr:MAG: DNA-directed RNA polymerase subunit F [Thermoprotei archaeon]RLF16600.1 MAG: DNA-directed RNA polymerase subunit F [Thermoprotei archaeon]
MKVRKMDEITIARAREVLGEVKEKWGELKHFQQVTLDFLTRFSKLSGDKAEELVAKLCEKFGLSKPTATQVVNIIPKSNEELRQILIKEGKTFLPEELNEMRKLLEEYLAAEEE